MKVIVTGSREWEWAPRVWQALDLFNPDVLVHGLCPTGADFYADIWGEERGVKVLRHPADWSQGKKAGPDRNKHMVNTNLDADYVLAFPLGESRGTRGCMAYAESKGLTVVNLGDR